MLRVRLASALRAVLSLVRGPARDQPWVEGGWPKAVPVVCLLAAPAFLSGAFRAALKVSLGVGLALGVVTTVGALAVFWPWIRRETRALRLRDLAFELCALVPVWYALRLLYKPQFAGFPNLDGWDGGTHVFLRNEFVARLPGVYNGFVTYYAVTHWLERLLHLDAFSSFSAAFYLAVAGYVAFPLVLAIAYTRARPDLGWPARLTAVAAALALELFLLRHVALPVLHYNQAMGFYAHVFGVLPVCLLWGVDALVRHERLRLVALLLALALVRYSYGLNLPDLLVATAAVLLLTAPRGGRALPQGALALVMVVGAWLGYRELLEVFRVRGGLSVFNLDAALASHLVLGGAIALSLALRHRERPDAPELPALVRYLRLPLAFLLVTTAGWAFFRGQEKMHYYYLTKYPMLATLVLVPACTLLAADVTGRLVATIARRRPAPPSAFALVRTSLLPVVLVVARTLWSGAYAAYAKGFEERSSGMAPPYVFLRPTADREALDQIPQILVREHKAFGGYLVSLFPLFSFMNGALGRHVGIQEYFPPDASPGHCVFWVGPKEDTFTTGPVHVLQGHRDALEAKGPPTCRFYKVPWKPSWEPHSLCWRCF